MKKSIFISLASIVIILTSCEKPISPETAKAFVGEYWMETNTYIMSGDQVTETLTHWSPVTIYMKEGKMFVQTEIFGAPDFESENPKSIEVYSERPNFSSSKLPAIITEKTAIDNPYHFHVIEVRYGTIRNLYHGICVQPLPIQVKSGSWTILNLKEFNPPVEVKLTDMAGTLIQTMQIAYEYGPMIKNGETIIWDVEYKDDYIPLNGQEREWERIIHKNTLYKR